MTTKTTRPRKPKPREFGQPDPGMWAPLPPDQNMVVRYLLTSGWYIHQAVHGNEGAWWEMSEILDDLSEAWDIAFTSQNSRKAESGAAP